MVTRRIATVLALSVLALAPAAAQRAYENHEHGFSFKPPSKDWSAVPRQPGQSLIVVKFHSEKEQQARKKPVAMNPKLEVLVFERKSVTGQKTRKDPDKKESEGSKLLKTLGVQSPKTFSDWLAKALQNPGSAKKRKINRIPCLEYQVTTSQVGGVTYRIPARISIYCFKSPTLEVVLKFECMEEWADKTVRKEFERCARTFRWIDKKDKEEISTEGMSEQEIFLQKQIEALPEGWDHLWSVRKRYLILYDAEEDFVKKLNYHLEAMRDYYEEVFPPDKPIEAVSIVRVCNNEDTYRAYGGPPRTGGYWASGKKELVLYDNKNFNRNEVFSVVSHEAFHQYIFYFYGELAPHSWYNEGHGDFFGGAKLSRSGKKVLRIEPLNLTRYPRHSMIKEAVRKGESIPLETFLDWSKSEYYGFKYAYPQGWSIVWFLRMGRKEGARVDAKWEAILDDYLDHLVAARDALMAENPGVPPMALTDRIQKAAYEKTFSDWTDEDWEEFEEAWEDFYS